MNGEAVTQSKDPRKSVPPAILTEDGGFDLSGGGGELTEYVSSEPDAGQTTDAWGADRQRRATAGPASTKPPPSRDTMPAPPGLMRELATEGSDGDESERPTMAVPAEDDPLREVADRYALGDYLAALRGAELELGSNPENEQARYYAENSRAYLEQQYASKIGTLDRVFVLAVPPSEVRWLGLDHQAEILLALLNGKRSVQDVLEMSSMDRLDALKTFGDLLDSGAVEQVG